jgi:hypothetical protein
VSQLDPAPRRWLGPGLRAPATRSRPRLRVLAAGRVAVLPGRSRLVAARRATARRHEGGAGRIRLTGDVQSEGLGVRGRTWRGHRRDDTRLGRRRLRHASLPMGRAVLDRRTGLHPRRAGWGLRRFGQPGLGVSGPWRPGVAGLAVPGGLSHRRWHPGPGRLTRGDAVPRRGPADLSARSRGRLIVARPPAPRRLANRHLGHGRAVDLRPVPAAPLTGSTVPGHIILPRRVLPRRVLPRRVVPPRPVGEVVVRRFGPGRRAAGRPVPRFPRPAAVPPPRRPGCRCPTRPVLPGSYLSVPRLAGRALTVPGLPLRLRCPASTVPPTPTLPRCRLPRPGLPIRRLPVRRRPIRGLVIHRLVINRRFVGGLTVVATRLDLSSKGRRPNAGTTMRATGRRVRPTPVLAVRRPSAAHRRGHSRGWLAWC